MSHMYDDDDDDDDDDNDNDLTAVSNEINIICEQYETTTSNEINIICEQYETTTSNEISVFCMPQKITDYNTKEDGEQLLAETEGRRRYTKEHELFIFELIKILKSM